MPTAEQSEGRLIVGPWREHTASAYRDDTCSVLQDWAEHFERIAAGQATLSPVNAAKLAATYRDRLAARVARLDRAAASASRRAGRDERAAERQLKWKREFEASLEDRRRREEGGTPIREVDLSFREMLWRQDIVTLEELAQRSEKELLAIDNVGPKRLQEVLAVLAERGLAPRPKDPHSAAAGA